MPSALASLSGSFRCVALGGLVSLVAGGCGPKAAPPSVERAAEAVADGVELRRPPLDDRSYRYLELDNGMKVLLVSDPETDMAAAALDVHVGQFSDPPDREGLAHFLEHMLFLGTDAFPDVDAYRDFVTSHGGRSNAGTGQEHTRYHFSVDHPHLEGGLDRFSAFFTSPRLDREYVTREREAVNSEYRLKVQTQARRFREVRRATSNPEHGFAKFSVGNLDTLADRPDDAVWDDLKAFYAEQYSASRMALVVVGRQDLERLEDLVRARFSAVPSDGQPVAPSTVPIYRPDQLGVRIQVQPLEELRELYMEFPVPRELDTYTRHPLDLLTALVGQEGPGSPHALLTERGWITRLSTGTDGAEDHSLFTVRLTLTEDGLEHVDDVAGVIFQYARLLRDAEDLRPYWDERRALSELGFRYREPARAVSLARTAARSLQLYPPEQVLSHHATWDDWDPALVDEHLARLRPGNARVFVTAPGVATDEVEARYEVPYGVEPLAPELMERWSTSPVDPALALPPRNPFIPEDTELLGGELDGEAVPELVVEEEGLEVWHLADTSFGVPRAVVTARIHLPEAAEGLPGALNLRLWTALVKYELAGPLEQARAAGVQADVRQSGDGLWLRVAGYDDTLPEVLATVVQGLVDAPLDAERFELLRQDMVRRYRNTTTDRPIDQVSRALSESLEPQSHGLLPSADHLAELELDTLRTWRDGLWLGAHVELLAHGNLSGAEAEAVGRRLWDALGATAVEPAPVVVRRVPVGRKLVRTVSVDHDDSAIRVLYQGEERSPEAQARWLMLGALVRTPAFTQLRTEQQLGYVVWGGYDRRDTVPGLTIGIQSGVAAPDVLLERIDAFLAGFSETLGAMGEEEYETVRSGLIAKLEERPTTLGQKSAELAADLELGVVEFDRKEQLVRILEGMGKAEVVALFEEQVRGETARRLVVQATGRAHAGAVDGGCEGLGCVVEGMAGEVVRGR
jgi:secreted Zn-dependent insulinase-like peptidase